ncbi:hypothetical protein F4561_001895 [Lipingzhangella halophila]|uniref:DUF397 domain-containing protein n=1 Tax=Lipingzhangella halophila TaxID=1783352 RepID=A0A7W7RFN5_9ACTN|nr:DUF397 domain-containing protein [Lipingzhangella halophila]MBB4931075.1 hypothetical protein [Lipingzhangella halophila]
MRVIEQTWRKSSYSNSKGGNCVEVADTVSGGAAIRDSRHPDLGHLSFPAPEWSAFLRGVQTGRL